MGSGRQAAFLFRTLMVVLATTSPLRFRTRRTDLPDRFFGAILVTATLPSLTFTVPSFLPPKVMDTLLTARSRTRILKALPARTLPLTVTFGDTAGVGVGVVVGVGAVGVGVVVGTGVVVGVGVGSSVGVDPSSTTQSPSTVTATVLPSTLNM